MTRHFGFQVDWLFFTVSRVGLQCVIVLFSDYTHFLGAWSLSLRLVQFKKKHLNTSYTCMFCNANIP